MEHQRTRNKRTADCFKAVYLLSRGWPVIKIAEALLMSAETVRHHFKCYKYQGIDKLLKNEAGGSQPRLNQVQLEKLEEHLDCHLYLCAKDVVRHVKKDFGISYSVRGLTHLLHRQGYGLQEAKDVCDTWESRSRGTEGICGTIPRTQEKQEPRRSNLFYGCNSSSA